MRSNRQPYIHSVNLVAREFYNCIKTIYYSNNNTALTLIGKNPIASFREVSNTQVHDNTAYYKIC